MKRLFVLALLSVLPLSALAQAVSVKDFGAKGDGVTDDSPAILRAVQSSADFIMFPRPGYYRIGTPLILPNARSYKTLIFDARLKLEATITIGVGYTLLGNGVSNYGGNAQHLSMCHILTT